MDMKHGFRRACLVGVVTLAAGVACGGTEASTRDASNPRAAADQAATPYQYRIIDSTRERPAVRGGPITPESVGANSPGGVRVK